MPLPKRIYSVSEKEFPDIVAFGESLVKAAIQGKDSSGVKEIYRRGCKYRRGEHLITQRRQDKKKFDSAVYNKFAEIIDNRRSHLMKANIKWDFSPTEEGDIWKADALKTLLSDVMWDYAQWDDKKEDSMLDCELAGSTHIKTIADPQTGYTDFVVLKNDAVFPDPLATNKDSLRYIVHMFPKPIADIEEDYGIAKGTIMPEPDIERVKSGTDKTEVEYTYQASSETDVSMPNVYDRHGGVFGENKMANDILGRAVVAEIWVEDKQKERIPFDISEIEEEHSDFAAGNYHKGKTIKDQGQLAYVSVDPKENHVEHLKYHIDRFNQLDPTINVREMQLLKDHIDAHSQYEQTEYRPKYPRGRIITLCQGNLLRDEPNRLPISWRDVFVKWDWFKEADKYWGKPPTVDIFDPQDAFNHRKNSITTNINNLNNGVAYIKQGVFENIFGKSKRAMSNLVGLVIPIQQHGDVQKDYGPPLPGHVIEDRDHSERFMDEVSGKSDLLSGKYPSGSPPMGTVDQLLGEAKTPLETILEHYALALKQMARNAIAIAAEFMDDDHKIRIIGEQNYQKYSQIVNWEDLRDGGLLDIRVGVRAELATARKERLRLAIELRREGIYDNTAVLERLDEPDKYEIMQRMSEIARLKADLQATAEIAQKAGNEVQRLSEVNRNMQMKKEAENAAGKKDKNSNKD